MFFCCFSSCLIIYDQLTSFPPISSPSSKFTTYPSTWVKSIDWSIDRSTKFFFFFFLEFSAIDMFQIVSVTLNCRFQLYHLHQLPFFCHLLVLTHHQFFPIHFLIHSTISKKMSYHFVISGYKDCPYFERVCFFEFINTLNIRENTKRGKYQRETIPSDHTTKTSSITKTKRWGRKGEKKRKKKKLLIH